MIDHAFSDYDKTCPIYKSVGMMASIVHFFNRAKKAIADSPPDAKITWASIQFKCQRSLKAVKKQKFYMPELSEEEMSPMFREVAMIIDEDFDGLTQ